MEKKIKVLHAQVKQLQNAMDALGDKFNESIVYVDFLEKEIEGFKLMLHHQYGDIEAMLIAAEAICYFHGEDSPLGSAIKERLQRVERERHATKDLAHYSGFREASERFQMALARKV